MTKKLNLVCMYVCVFKIANMFRLSKAPFPNPICCACSTAVHSIWYRLYFPTPIRSLAPFPR